MSKENQIIKLDDIQDRIHTIHNIKVILDRDLAELYKTETRTLKQSVKRNIERFPVDFMFELTPKDIDSLVSQSVIPSKSYFGGAMPYAFTEQGVSMLSAVLKTPIAVEISLKIIRTFVEIRKFTINNAGIFQRLDNVEQKQLVTDSKLDKVLDAIELGKIKPKQGIFYNGQIFDAYKLVSDIVRTTKKSIILIDNYIDDTTLQLFTKRNPGVKVKLYTKTISKSLKQDLSKYNSQYEKIELLKLQTSHDRFMIIDYKTVYHFGASLKDLGKKWFAFSKLEIDAKDLIEKLDGN